MNLLVQLQDQSQTFAFISRNHAYNSVKYIKNTINKMVNRVETYIYKIISFISLTGGLFNQSIMQLNLNSPLEKVDRSRHRALDIHYKIKFLQEMFPFQLKIPCLRFVILYTYLRYDYTFFIKSQSGAGIFITRVSDDPIYLELLDVLAFIREDLCSICLYHSQVQHSFFMKLASTQLNITVLDIFSCKLGDTLAYKLFPLKVSRLQRLYFGDDKLSNKGVKSFMKLDIPNLEHLIIKNTDITNDCLKLFIKRSYPKMGYWGIGHQSKFQYDLLFSTLPHFFSFQNDRNHIMLWNDLLEKYARPNAFIFKLSKLKISKAEGEDIQVYDQERNHPNYGTSCRASFLLIDL